jgi:hypothetical protein
MTIGKFDGVCLGEPLLEHVERAGVGLRSRVLPRLLVVWTCSRRARHVRFAPKADKRQTIAACPLSADIVAKVF